MMNMFSLLFGVFFFKQKTAYEMRISDWSSDVCSSDLMQRWFAADASAGDPYYLYAASNLGSFAGLISYPALVEPSMPLAAQSWGWTAGYALLVLQIGRAHV